LTRRRHGRPRLPGARTKSGRLIKPRDTTDHGSELLQAQRAILANWAFLAKTDDDTEEPQMGDKVMTSSALGALFTVGIIDQAQFDAGTRYGRLYAAVAGRVSPPAIVLNDDRAGKAPEDDAEREERRIRDEASWKAAAAALKAVGRRAKDQVDNAAVFNRRARFLESSVVRPSDARDALALGAGLEALVGAFGMRKAARAA